MSAEITFQYKDLSSKVTIFLSFYIRITPENIL